MENMCGDRAYDLDEALLDRYLAGNASPDEVQRVEALFTSSPVNAAFFKGVRSIQGTGAGSFVPDLRRGQELLRERVGFVPRIVTSAMLAAAEVRSATYPASKALPGISGADTKTSQRRALTTPRVLNRGIAKQSWYFAAFAFLGVVLLGREVKRSFAESGQQQGVSAIYTTKNAEVTALTLPDGSAVTLNAGSRLEVPHNFANGNRALKLYGQGVFSVAHQPNAPFTVEVGKTVTRVLGTIFSVREYDSDTAAIVTVVEGKVAVQSTVLTASQQMVIGRTGLGHVQLADTMQLSFMRGVLTLDYRPLPEAIAELNRWYDVDIRLGDRALSKLNIGGRFVAGTRETLIDLLEISFDVRVVQEGQILTIYSKR